MYLDTSQYLSQYLLDTSRSIEKPSTFLRPSQHIKHYGSAKIINTKNFITYLFEIRIEIHLNNYLKDIISHLLEGFLERETLFLYG